MLDEVVIRTDGGAEGNPGPAASAFVVENGGRIVCVHSEYIGVATNNQAEYKALLMALRYVKKNFFKKKVKLFSDSQLMIKQLKGEYRIKSSNLVSMWSEARELIGKMDISLEWVKRDENYLADFLVKMVRKVKNG